MLIQDVLLRDPATHPLVNHGQARISEVGADQRARDELRAELQTFVCEGQFAAGIERILGSYLADLHHTRQRAAWVSGFFGSGKSHLLKMLSHLWCNTTFPDGVSARALVPALPAAVVELLRELDVAGRRAGGLFAAAGTLPSGTTERVRLTVLAILLRAAGLPEQLPLANFCLWLEDNGWLDPVRAAVAAAGKVWQGELNHLYLSPLLAQAVLACDPNLASTPAELQRALRAQFPQPASDLTTAEFVAVAQRVLHRAGRDQKLPCTILVLDEVQQFIGPSEIASTLVTELAEAVATQLGSQVLLVGAGQSALSQVRNLEKLMDRFSIAVQLSDTDVSAVTRKVLLQKQPAALPALNAMLEDNAGEIARQLQGTNIAARPADRPALPEDYPLLPARRRFWEACFRQLDTAGTESQLRSQLRILHDALVKLALQPLGALVPGSDLYDALAPGLVTLGALPRQISDRILELGQSDLTDARLRQQICGLAFLIGELNRKPGSPANLGIRATPEHIADLLVADLAADNTDFRHQVAKLLADLAEAGTLTRIGDEYRIQTEEGRAWEQDFRARERALAADLANRDEQREKLLGAELERLVRETRLLQGVAKVPRRLQLHQAPVPPPVADSTIPVWVRDQFTVPQPEVLDAARRLGNSSPVISVFLPQRSADELRDAIAAAQAAEQVLQARGPATADADILARRAMQSRLDLARQRRDALIGEIVAAGEVYQAGGGAIKAITIDEKIKAAAEVALVRLFPSFHEADYPAAAWEAVLKRARDGADRPLDPIKFDSPPDQHPVCQQVLAAIGPGNSGSQIRQQLESSPCGWPRDAIDAALILLHRLQHTAVTLNGAPLAPGQLDQAKIPKAQFQVEATVLTLEDRLAARRLYQLADIPCRAGEEPSRSSDFLRKLRDLAAAAGGPAPLPPPPPTLEIAKLEALEAVERVAQLRALSTQLEEMIQDCMALAQRQRERLPAWQLAERLAGHARELPGAVAPLAQLEAVRQQRSLLQPADPIPPLKAALASALRLDLDPAAAGSLGHASRLAFDAAFGTLESNQAWRQLSAPQREPILAAAGLRRHSAPDLATDAALLQALDHQNLSARRAEADAAPARAQRALALAAQALEPKIQFVPIERATLRTPAEVEAWAETQKRALLAALERGPVQVQ